MIGGLLLAWILNIFGFGQIVITAMKELFDIDISMAAYYFIFAIIGSISIRIKE